ncbi:MAG: hypothetical protein HOV83_05620, partial [Catenulispora sp.]|nr:hypothetical protein [Catenulispora sp.]
GTDLESFRDGLLRMRVPMLDSAGMDRFVYLINNADPVTAAPETRVPARGLGRLIELAVKKRYGYYQPEFQTDEYWQRVRVPCPHCKPSRDGSEVDWAEHMRLPADHDRTDYFGYFSADPADLASGWLTCPGCGHRLPVGNRRGTRTVWQPVQSTEADQDRPVLWRLPVWEVL